MRSEYPPEPKLFEERSWERTAEQGRRLGAIRPDDPLFRDLDNLAEVRERALALDALEKTEYPKIDLNACKEAGCFEATPLLVITFLRVLATNPEAREALVKALTRS
jgi:hypothetical protein